MTQPKPDLDEKERITLLRLEVQIVRKALVDLVRIKFNELEGIIDGKIRKD